MLIKMRSLLAATLLVELSFLIKGLNHVCFEKKLPTETAGQIGHFPFGGIQFCQVDLDPNAVDSRIYTGMRVKSTATSDHPLAMTIEGYITDHTVGNGYGLGARVSDIVSLACTTNSGTRTVVIEGHYHRTDLDYFGLVLVSPPCPLDLSMSTMACSVVCNAGRGVPNPCDFNRPSLCSTICASNQFTSGNQCVTCGSGFTSNAARNGCVDINECVGNHGCPSGTFCQNTPGSFACVDVNECADPDHCPSGTNCVNTEGSADCVDIDECGTGQFSCPANSQCENIPESYNCVCDFGFAVVGSSPATRVGDSSSTCYSLDYTIQTTTVLSTKASVSIQGAALPFNIALYIVDEKNRKFEVEQFEADARTFDLEKLVPGTTYQVTAFAAAGIPGGSDPGVATLFVTACTCQDSPANNVNGNGKPQNFIASQEDGHVYFTFTDSSRCEEAYSFERINPLEGGTSVFAPNYYFQPVEMCGDQFAPGAAAADQLALSKLEIGKQYVYCARAIASPTYTSASSCTNHTIQWQASVRISVTLPPESGRLPVRDVDVVYFLNDHEGNAVQDGSVRTGRDGKALLSFSVLPTVPTELDSIFSLTLRISKVETFQNGTVEHTFLCDGGAIDCSSGRSAINLEHLEFGKLVEVFDETSLPINGVALIAATGDPACALPGVDVCIQSKRPGATATQSVSGDDFCVTTNSFGEFSIPAVIGTTVVLVARYKGHDFEFVHASTDIQRAIGSDSKGPGIVIQPGEFYEGFVFKDVTQATLTVNVVGGLCDRNLGRADLTYTIVGCNSWEGLDLVQESTKAEYFVPAHRIEMSATVFTAETLASQIIDLSSIEEAESNTDPNNTDITAGSGLEGEEANAVGSALSKQEEESSATSLRFQYDGQIELSFDTLTNRAGGCSSSYPVVLPAYRVARIRVRIAETFLFGIPSCDVFPRDAKMFISNKLGLNTLASTSDRGFRDRVAVENPELLPLYEFCNESCSAEIEYDEGLNNARVNAHVTLQVLVGPPNLAVIPNGNPLDDHLKSLNVRFVQGSTTTSADLNVLVVGDYDQGFVDSINLPTHKPVMILRDPPGGLSSVTYENMETVFKVRFSKFERKVGSTSSFDGDFSSGLVSRLCIGLGGGLAGPFFSNCGKLETTQKRGVNLDSSSSQVSEHSEDKHTAKYSTTWSFSTSSNQWVAGKMSDVFVVPTINLEFNRVVEIGLDTTTCLSTMLDKVKFDVAKESAVSFLTFMDLTMFELPSYQSTADSLLLQLATETDPDKIDFLTAARAETLDAIISWQGIISAYEDTNLEAMNRGALSVRPDQWFEKLADDHNDAKTTLKGFKSGLIPTRLEEGAEVIRDTISSLDVTEVITFSGGGSKYTFKLKETFDSEEVHLEGPVEANSEVSNNKGFFAALEAKFRGIGANLKRETKFDEHSTSIKTYTKGHSSESSVSFTLGDPDLGDKFNVQIALDSKYKSFVFTLKPSSRTKCPHEGNSVRRESPRIEVVERPTSPVLPDEPILFRLRLTNDGLDRSSFQLTTDLRENPDGLASRLSKIGHTIEYIGGQESLETTLKLYRGPREYSYAPFYATLRSTCEFSTGGDGNMFGIPDLDRTQAKTLLFNDDASQRIVFAQPCAKIGIAKPRSADTIVVNAEEPLTKNVEIVIRNFAAAEQGTLQNQTGFTRLETVSLKFREKGLPRSFAASFIDSESQLQAVEFADNAKEDELGFSKVVWNIEDDKLIDGEYEVWVESVCTEIPGAPPGFNEYQTAVLSMVVDRRFPKLFGGPEPAAGDIFIGEPVRFHFTERIDCYTFKLEVFVEGLNRVFDNKINNNLLVLCEDRTVAFQFDATNQDLDDLIGKKFNMTLTNVADLHGNNMADNVFHELTFATVDLTTVGVTFELVVNRNCTLTVAALQAEIAALLQLPEAEHDRVQVSNLRCSGPARMTATVVITATAVSGGDSNQTRRLLEEPLALSPLQRFYQLRNLIEEERRRLQQVMDIEGLGGFMSLSKLQIIAEAESVQERVFYIPNAPDAQQGALVDARLANMESTVSALHQDLQVAVAGLAVTLVALVAALVVLIVMAKRRSSRPKSLDLSYVDPPQASMEHIQQGSRTKHEGPPI